MNIISMKLKLIIFILSFVFFLGIAAPSNIVAQTEQQNAVCKGSTLQISSNVSGECKAIDNEPNNAEKKVNNLITDIVNIFSVIVGVVAVIMIIYGGFRYITSGGEAGNLTTSKNIILYALIGLVIVALAQVIVKFVLSKIIN